jgi:hypothetical protein
MTEMKSVLIVDGLDPSPKKFENIIYWERFTEPHETNSTSLPELIRKSENVFTKVMDILSENKKINSLFSQSKIDGINLWETLFLTQPSWISNSFHLEIAKFLKLEEYCISNNIAVIYLNLKDKMLFYRIKRVISGSANLSHIELHSVSGQKIYNYIMGYLLNLVIVLKIFLKLILKFIYYLIRGIIFLNKIDNKRDAKLMFVSYAKNQSNTDGTNKINFNNYWPGLDKILSSIDHVQIINILVNSKLIELRKPRDAKNVVNFARCITSKSSIFILKNYFRSLSNFFQVFIKIKRDLSVSNNIFIFPIIKTNIIEILLGGPYLDFLIDCVFWKNMIRNNTELKKIYYLLEGHSWEYILNFYVNSTTDSINTFGVMHSFPGISDSRIFNISRTKLQEKNNSKASRTVPKIIIVNGLTQKSMCEHYEISSNELLILESLRYSKIENFTEQNMITFFSSLDLSEANQLYKIYDKFSHTSNLKTLFVPHPASKFKQSYPRTNNKTQDLINKSKIIVCSESTSVSISALINKKPLIILKNPNVFAFHPESLSLGIKYCNDYLNFMECISDLLTHPSKGLEYFNLFIDPTLARWKKHITSMHN